MSMRCSVCGGQCKWVGFHTQCIKCEAIGTAETPEDYQDDFNISEPDSEGGDPD